MPVRARRLCKAQVGMKTKAHRDRSLGTCDHRRFQGEAVGTKSHRQLNAVTKRKDGKKITAGPIEPGRQEIFSRFSYDPGKQRPWHTVHGKPVFVEMEKWR